MIDEKTAGKNPQKDEFNISIDYKIAAYQCRQLILPALYEAGIKKKDLANYLGIDYQSLVVFGKDSKPNEFPVVVEKLLELAYSDVQKQKITFFKYNQAKHPNKLDDSIAEIINITKKKGN